MVHNFKSDRQRKKVMAELSSQSIAPTRPTLFGRIKAGEKKFEEALVERRERRGRERIAKESLEFEREAAQARRLEAEAKLESSRELITQRRLQAEAQLKEINRLRRERRLAPIRRAAAVGAGLITAGSQVLSEKQAKRRKKPKKKEANMPLPFGIKLN